jgi:hypothetical protein
LSLIVTVLLRVLFRHFIEHNANHVGGEQMLAALLDLRDRRVADRGHQQHAINLWQEARRPMTWITGDAKFFPPPLQTRDMVIRDYNQPHTLQSAVNGRQARPLGCAFAPPRFRAKL